MARSPNSFSGQIERHVMSRFSSWLFRGRNSSDNSQPSPEQSLMSANSDSTYSRGAMIVTGGSRGIGAAVARLGGRRGYDVVINFRSDAAAAESVANDIRAAGSRALCLQADISGDAGVTALFDAATRFSGDLRAVVTCAGIPGPRALLRELTPAEIRRVIDTNLTGTMLCAGEAMRRMSTGTKGAGGSIVLLSSQSATRGGNQLAAYAASKAAVESLAVSLARETDGTGIRVNAVSPGIIATDQQPLNDADWIARASADIPLGRLGSPDEVAQAVLWLVSEDASYVNGAVIGVTGGR
jgi:NAD(P)-dependent dehydrogenase (short-subunit alcohol dehydrogenase family)